MADIICLAKSDTLFRPIIMTETSPRVRLREALRNTAGRNKGANKLTFRGGGGGGGGTQAGFNT